MRKLVFLATLLTLALLAVVPMTAQGFIAAPGGDALQSQPLMEVPADAPAQAEATPEATAEAAAPPPDAGTAPVESATGTTIAQLLNGDGRFDTILSAAATVGFVGQLNSPTAGPFTVFAPTDEAFRNLSEETIAALQEDPELLADTIRYHILPGAAPREVLLSADFARTAARRTVFLANRPDGSISVNGTATILTSVEASNGWIHVVDQVLSPIEGTNVRVVITAEEVPILEIPNGSPEGAVLTRCQTVDVFATTGTFLLLRRPFRGWIPVSAVYTIEEFGESVASPSDVGC